MGLPIFRSFNVHQLTKVLRSDDPALVAFCDSLRTEGYHQNDPMQSSCVQKCKANYAALTPGERDENTTIFTTMKEKEKSLWNRLHGGFGLLPLAPPTFNLFLFF